MYPLYVFIFTILFDASLWKVCIFFGEQLILSSVLFIHKIVCEFFRELILILGISLTFKDVVEWVNLRFLKFESYKVTDEILSFIHEVTFEIGLFIGVQV